GIVLPVYACRLLGLSVSGYFSRILIGPLLVNIPFTVCLVLVRAYLPNGYASLAVGLPAGAILNGIIYWRWVMPADVRRNVLTRLGLRPASERSEKASLCDPTPVAAHSVAPEVAKR